MSEYLETLDTLMDEIIRGFQVGSEIHKKWQIFQENLQQLQKESVIADTEDIKGTDETVRKKPVQPSPMNPPSDDSIEMEFCADGVYRPKRARLEEKV